MEVKQEMIHSDIFFWGGSNFYFHAMIKPLNIGISVDLALEKQYTEKFKILCNHEKIEQFPTHSVREIATKLYNKCLKHCDVLKFSNGDKINYLLFSHCNQKEREFVPPGTQQSQTLNTENCNREIKVVLLLASCKEHGKAIAQKPEFLRDLQSGCFKELRGTGVQKHAGGANFNWWTLGFGHLW